jgi:AraC-like DNA-binding protein
MTEDDFQDRALAGLARVENQLAALPLLVREVQLLRGEVAALRALEVDRLVSMGEVAARAGCSKKTLYRRIADGKLTPIKRPNGTYFAPEEVNRAFLVGDLP